MGAGPAARVAADATQLGPSGLEPVALGSPPRVVVVADDLIWSTRLVDQLTALGAVPLRAHTPAALEAAIASGAADRAVVDLTARAYDGVAAVRRAASAGMRVLCVGQHDDLALRRAARQAGADRVCAYRTLFEAGAAVLATWLGASAPAPGSGRPLVPAGEGEASPA